MYFWINVTLTFLQLFFALFGGHWSWFFHWFSGGSQSQSSSQLQPAFYRSTEETKERLNRAVESSSNKSEK